MGMGLGVGRGLCTDWCHRHYWAITEREVWDAEVSTSDQQPEARKDWYESLGSKRKLLG